MYVYLCRPVVVVGVKCRGRGRKTWGECVKNDMELLGLQPESMNFCQNFRLKLLKSGPERFEEDGLRSLQYNCRLMEERKLYTWIYVNLDEQRVLAVRIITFRIVMIMQIRRLSQFFP